MQNLEHQGHARARIAPMVSIVVPCRNERDHIELAIKSILAQKIPPGGFEVIVADGMSDDGTREILNRMAETNSQLKIVDNPGAIVSTGLNAAIRASRGSIIIRMDAHTSYAPDYIRQCVRVLQDSGADNVGGPWIARGRGKVGRAIAAAFQSPFGCGGARSHKPSYSGPVDSVYLGCWRREIFDRIGFFDEDLVRNQDDELNLRIIRNGGTIWQSAEIKSWYHPRESWCHLFRQYLQYGYWKAAVLRKHRRPGSGRHLIPSTFVFTLMLLPLLSILWANIFWGWMALLGLYIGVNVVMSALTAIESGWNLFPVLPPVFAAFHFAYGFGFLRGCLDFIVLRKGFRESYTVLTRSSRAEVIR